MKIITKLALVACVALLATPAMAQIDCEAFANYHGVEPEGYAQQCLGAAPAPATSNAPGRAPDDMAFAHDIGFISDDITNHPNNDLSAGVVVGTSTAPVFGYDYDSTLSTLYAIDTAANTLSISDGVGGLAPVGPLNNPLGEAWTGLAVDPMTDTIYASAVSCNVSSSLYTVDPATGASTLIGTDTLGLCMIAIAMNCDGELYGHDIITDSIYLIDTATGAHTLVGPTGLAANFAQGMDFDNEDGTLYIHGYTGGGTNTYGTVDLGSGAITPVNVDNPLGEFEGATMTMCPGGAPDTLGIPTLGGVGMAALVGLLLLASLFFLRRQPAA